MNDRYCPCNSNKPYIECCKPFHEGKLPHTALELMRSRFAAYVLDMPDYIINTTHPACSQYRDNKLAWRRALTNFSQNSSFNKLEILDSNERGSHATVTFTAYINQNDTDSTFTEKSYFEKVKGKWLYKNGIIEEGLAPNLVTIEQLRLLPLAYYGAPVLRRKADEIAEITDEIKKLIEEMVETMDACNGVGLAAPQVHHSIRLFIMRKPIEDDKGKGYEKGELQVFINPKLSSPSKKVWVESEGCLSIPGLRADVERPFEITVEYTDLDGKRQVKKVSGWEAKIIMHENDHINGVLFIDRLGKKEREKLEPYLKTLEARLSDFHNL